MKNGDENQKNVAFVQIDDLPEYKMCLQKKGITTNDDEIFNIVKETGITYYRYYAVADDGDEKVYLDNFEEAEEVVDELKDKDSNNASDLTIVEKYETELPELASTDDAVSKLYEKKVVVVPKKVTYSRGNGTIGSSRNVNNSSQKVDLGISLIRPVNGTISCRFGNRGSYYHTGLDIATSYGTPIKAAASGTVTYAGYHYSYGNLLIVTHANGVQTYYAHCSKLYASVGQTVSQGQTIAAVGSTGNSTGNHLHLEVRVNGRAQNPQNYLY